MCDKCKVIKRNGKVMVICSKNKVGFGVIVIFKRRIYFGVENLLALYKLQSNRFRLILTL